MASPPSEYSYSPAAMSPPHPSHSQLPPINTKSMNKKRASEGGAAPSLKRRKASAISLASAAGGGSAHPLRQTSFPPGESGTPFSARSPSVDFDNMSLISGSQVSAAGPPKKKRGRKSKAEKAREQTPSVAGARGNIAGSDVGGRGGNKGSAAGADDEDAEVVENDGPTEIATTVSSLTKEQEAAERKALIILTRTFSSEMFHRYENWRAAGLQKASIRKLVNATISQSVSENIVIAMRAVSKLYMGDLIETARYVQAEWIAKTGEKQTDLLTPPPEPAAPTGSNEDVPESQAKDQGSGNDSPPPIQDNVGPLRPEHLREAVRRYKLAFEGNGVGLHALWHQQQQAGVERFPTRTGGRRIFR